MKRTFKKVTLVSVVFGGSSIDKKVNVVHITLVIQYRPHTEQTPNRYPLQLKYIYNRWMITSKYCILTKRLLSFLHHFIINKNSIVFTCKTFKTSCSMLVEKLKAVYNPITKSVIVCMEKNNQMKISMIISIIAYFVSKFRFQFI